MRWRRVRDWGDYLRAETLADQLILGEPPADAHVETLQHDDQRTTSASAAADELTGLGAPATVGAGRTGSRVRPERGQEEGGARPPRPRHCDRGRKPRELATGAGHRRREGRGSRTIREPENLPGTLNLTAGLRGEARVTHAESPSPRRIPTRP